VRGDVQALEVLAARLNLLEDADVFPQVLQVLGSFLKEDFDGFAIERLAHALPSVTSSAF
jgi:hypothetical protein